MRLALGSNQDGPRPRQQTDSAREALALRRACRVNRQGASLPHQLTGSPSRPPGWSTVCDGCQGLAGFGLVGSCLGGAKNSESAKFPAAEPWRDHPLAMSPRRLPIKKRGNPSALDKMIYRTYYSVSCPDYCVEGLRNHISPLLAAPRRRFFVPSCQGQTPRSLAHTPNCPLIIDG